MTFQWSMPCNITPTPFTRNASSLHDLAEQLHGVTYLVAHAATSQVLAEITSCQIEEARLLAMQFLPKYA